MDQPSRQTLRVRKIRLCVRLEGMCFRLSLLSLSNLVWRKQRYTRCESSLVASTGGKESWPGAIGAERGYLDVLGAKPCTEQQFAIREREIDVEFFGVGVGEQWNIVARIAEE